MRKTPSQDVAQVYPRERGGTLTRIYDEATGKGLSPRTRGNLSCQVVFTI